MHQIIKKDVFSLTDFSTQLYRRRDCQALEGVSND
jgi:hypothetical protein